jgi:O-antigen/teichoic acid export membrane protein
MRTILKKTYTHFMKDSLYRNSVFIMGGTVIGSAMGFVFWKINTFLFSPSEVGIATLIISGCQLLATLSLLGFNQMLVKTIPKSKRRDELVVTSITVVSVAALVASIIYIALLPVISHKLTFIYKDFYFIPLFLIFTIMTAVNTLTDNVFIALKSANYIVIENVALGLLKLCLPFIFIDLGALGIVNAYFISVTGALVVTYIGFNRLGINLKKKIKLGLLKSVVRFSSTNYVVSLFGSATPLLLPTIIVGFLGTASAAYYYIAVTLTNILAIVPLSTANALYAEITHDPLNLPKHVIRSTLIIFAMMSPILIILLAFGKYVLLFFGKDYSVAATHLLQLLVLGSVPIAIKNILGSVLRFYDAMKIYMLLEFITAIGITFGSIALMPAFGISGVGLAWLITHSITGLLFIIFALRSHRLSLAKQDVSINSLNT